MRKISCDFTPRTVIAIFFLALFTLLSVAVPPVRAQPVPSPALKPYSKSPLTEDDFVKPPPDPRPVKDGVKLNAEIVVGLDDPFKTNSKFTIDPNTKEIIVTTTSTIPKAIALMDKNSSWFNKKLKPKEKRQQLLDHEQGHMDVTQIHARLLQAKFDKMKADGELTITTKLPPGTSVADIKTEFDRQEKEIGDRVDAKFKKQKDLLNKESQKYDDDTKHGTDPDAQKKARDAQRKTLNPKKKKGPDAESRANKTIRFDAVSGRLTMDSDFIVGVDPNDSGFVVSAGDPVLGSEVVIPAFSLVGRQDDGIFFFTGVDTSARLEIRDATDPLFTVALDYLLYDPSVDLFFGVGGDFDVPGNSAFIDRLVADLSSGPPALFGIEFHPDVNFSSLTAGFTLSGASAFTNALGARIIATPEPGSQALFAAGLLMAIWLRRRRLARLSLLLTVSPRRARKLENRYRPGGRSIIPGPYAT